MRNRLGSDAFAALSRSPERAAIRAHRAERPVDLITFGEPGAVRQLDNAVKALVEDHMFG